MFCCLIGSELESLSYPDPTSKWRWNVIYSIVILCSIGGSSWEWQKLREVYGNKKSDRMTMNEERMREKSLCYMQKNDDIWFTPSMDKNWTMRIRPFLNFHRVTTVRGFLNRLSMIIAHKNSRLLCTSMFWVNCCYKHQLPVVQLWISSNSKCIYLLWGWELTYSIGDFVIVRVV